MNDPKKSTKNKHRHKVKNFNVVLIIYDAKCAIGGLLNDVIFKSEIFKVIQRSRRNINHKKHIHYIFELKNDSSKFPKVANIIVHLIFIDIQNGIFAL